MNIANLDAYLSTIARNIAYNALRRQRLDRRLSEVAAADFEEISHDTEALSQLNETKRILQAAIGKRPPK